MADIDELQLADSDGVLIETDKDTFLLEDYYKRNDYKPSKHKMYIVYKEKVYSIG